MYHWHVDIDFGHVPYVDMDTVNVDMDRGHVDMCAQQSYMDAVHVRMDHGQVHVYYYWHYACIYKPYEG